MGESTHLQVSKAGRASIYMLVSIICCCPTSYS